MLCKIFFSLFERLWGCALSWSLATPNLKPIRNSGNFLREGHIHMKDSSASPRYFKSGSTQSIPNPFLISSYGCHLKCQSFSFILF
jgi:hypothetical protein